jgi:hypothetical protein
MTMTSTSAFARLMVPLLALLAVAPVMVPVRVAHAADQRTAAALQKFDAGRQAFEAGRFEQAALAFQASQELLPSPNTHLYLGRCFRALGKVGSAFTLLRLAAREAQDRLTATGEGRFAATRDAATREAAELEHKVPRLTIAVPAGTPAGFVVTRDGQDLPRAAWGVEIEADPGVVVVEARGPRLAVFRRVLTLAEGARQRVEIEARRLPTATVELNLSTRPSGLAVTLDDAPLEPSAVTEPHEVDAGDHTLVVRAPGYVPFQWRKSLSDGERASVEVVLRAAPYRLATPKWMFFAASGGALAALGAATGIAVHAQSLEHQQLALDPYGRDPGVRDAVRSQATTANILFVTGGVLGIGAAVLGLTTRWRDPRLDETATTTLWVTAYGGGGSIHGTF